MQRLVNPEGSAYRSETGGLMEALRNLSVEQSMSFGLLQETIANLDPSTSLPSYLLRASQLVARRLRQVGIWHSLPARCGADQGGTLDHPARSKSRTAPQGLAATFRGNSKCEENSHCENRHTIRRISREG